MGRQVTAVGGDGGFSGPADEGEGQIAQSGHDLGGRAGAQAGVILTEGDVAEVVTDFNAPACHFGGFLGS